MIELLGSLLGAVLGAIIAGAVGGQEYIVVAAIAGSFIGGSLATSIRRSRESRRTPPQ